MKSNQADLLIKVLYSCASALILLGAFFKLQHYPYGSQLLITGSILGIVMLIIDNTRLKNQLKNYKSSRKIRRPFRLN